MTIKKIVIILIVSIFIPVIYAQDDNLFFPKIEAGDRWVIRREIGNFTDSGGNVDTIQYWKYEVASSITIDNKDYLTIFISSDETKTSIKLLIQKDKFILKEITENDGSNSIACKMEEVAAPVIEIRDKSHLYDLPAFPIIDPNLADKNIIVTPSGNKRLRVNFKRHNYSRGDVVTSELIWQETDKIGVDVIKKYGRLSDDYANKIDKDGYYLMIKGEKRRVKQIWVETVPWWIYNESANERDYLISFYPNSK